MTNWLRGTTITQSTEILDIVLLWVFWKTMPCNNVPITSQQINTRSFKELVLQQPLINSNGQGTYDKSKFRKSKLIIQAQNIVMVWLKLSIDFTALRAGLAKTWHMCSCFSCWDPQQTLLIKCSTLCHCNFMWYQILYDTVLQKSNSMECGHHVRRMKQFTIPETEKQIGYLSGNSPQILLLRLTHSYDFNNFKYSL